MPTAPRPRQTGSGSRGPRPTGARTAGARRAASLRRIRGTVTHAVPGRLRVRIDGATPAQRREAIEALEGLRVQPGISEVATDTDRGSALLSFDPESLDVDSALQLVREAHLAFEDIAPPVVEGIVDKSVSHVATQISQRAGHADEQVRRATHGALDLKMIVPLGLGALAIRQVMRTGFLVESMPWYMLAYYSFDTFVKLHGPQPNPAHHQQHAE